MSLPVGRDAFEGGSQDQSRWLARRLLLEDRTVGLWAHDMARRYTLKFEKGARCV
jgi:hypothetical protein